MELSAWITLAVLAVMIVALYTERVPPGPAVLGTVVVLMLIGVITPEQAFAGFSNEAPIIVACLLIVARAVDVAGIMQPIVTRLFRGADSSTGILSRLLFPLAGISAFINNTTLVAMTVPAVVDISARRSTAGVALPHAGELCRHPGRGDYHHRHIHQPHRLRPAGRGGHAAARTVRADRGGPADCPRRRGGADPGGATPAAGPDAGGRCPGRGRPGLHGQHVGRAGWGGRRRQCQRSGPATAAGRLPGRDRARWPFDRAGWPGRTPRGRRPPDLRGPGRQHRRPAARTRAGFDRSASDRQPGRHGPCLLRSGRRRGRRRGWADAEAGRLPGTLRRRGDRHSSRRPAR